jgi:hypothetical protein
MDYAHTSCQNGYSAGYDNKLKWTDNTIVQKYRDSNSLSARLCAHARTKAQKMAIKLKHASHLAIEIWLHVKMRTIMVKIRDIIGHPDDNDATSCYNLGHEAGYASAEKELVRCHEVSVPTLLSGHSPQFTGGWIEGWTEANTKVENQRHMGMDVLNTTSRSRTISL